MYSFCFLLSFILFQIFGEANKFYWTFFKMGNRPIAPGAQKKAPASRSFRLLESFKCSIIWYFVFLNFRFLNNTLHSTFCILLLQFNFKFLFNNLNFISIIFFLIYLFCCNFWILYLCFGIIAIKFHVKHKLLMILFIGIYFAILIVQLIDKLIFFVLFKSLRNSRLHF